MADSKLVSYFCPIEVQIDLRRKTSLTTGLNLLIVLLIDRRAWTLGNPFRGNAHHTPAEPPLPIHRANTGVVVILRAALALLFIRAVRMMVETAPPSRALIELRFAGAVRCAASQLPVPVVAEPIEITAAAKIRNRGHRAVLQPLEYGLQSVHDFDAA